MKKLIQFLCSITKQLKQSQKGTGINCYDIDAITKHKAQIIDLCNTCGWRLSHFEASTKFDAKTGQEITSQASYFLGPQSVDSEDDLLDAFCN